LIIKYLNIDENMARENGGGLYSSLSKNISFEHIKVLNNMGVLNGGGIYLFTIT
jgi:hypothetical protein